LQSWRTLTFLAALRHDRIDARLATAVPTVTPGCSPYLLVEVHASRTNPPTVSLLEL
jgi:hypothetical protein